MQQSASSADCPSQGTISYCSPTPGTVSDIPSKPTLKTQIKKRTHDLKTNNYNGLTEEEIECKRFKVNAQAMRNVTLPNITGPINSR
ncbi:hypothetical protein PoB_007397100 [Plakobranchus ocellatus]|uniref:Uncharacterized protein n=1 Tax=Plakobranchus ocellatus TaxID=259542 RepID=A0AAV4DTR5_9GAST|nr:hypothetical protein PoB_007397100 [Plakobranchus ocellatus]